MSTAYRRCSVLTQPQDPKCRITAPCDACCERCWSPPRNPLPRRPLCTGGCALQLLHYGALYGAAPALPMQSARLFAAEQAVNQSKSCSPDAETARLQHHDETNKHRAPWVRLSRSWAAPVLALLLAWGPSPDRRTRTQSTQPIPRNPSTARCLFRARLNCGDNGARCFRWCFTSSDRIPGA
ncbi:hypothetical protein EDB80DRAFT_110179 [Ilyonectria destructans]|nr:hypothetical protein EDB80DRAFT_110179 [Ilyonectria destructans]